MTEYAISLAAPRYRQFFPTAPEMVYRLGVDGEQGRAPKLITKFSASSVVQTYALTGVPSDYRSTGSLWITVNGVPQANEYLISGYVAGKPVWDWSTFEHNRASNSITLRKALSNGDVLEVWEAVPSTDGFVRLAIPRHIFVQGARGFPLKAPTQGDPTPEPPVFPTPDKNPVETFDLSSTGPDGQFLGAFNCRLEILSPCTNGVARLGQDKRSFEYRRNTGYTGRDSFSYRVISSLGQQSDAACVQLYVGI